MGIFRRGTKDTSRGTRDGSAQEGSAQEVSALADSAEASSAEASSAARSGTATSEQPRKAATGAGRREGPFDRSEVESLDGRLDLGALWLTGVPGMELRLEVEEESQNVVGVTAVLGESAVQLQAFAAPRSEGIWEEIRTEIAASITSQGGTADKTSGPLGMELRAQMPGQDAHGRTVFSPVRFVGIDGPRWFLRAVLSGPAATDEGDASTLLDVVKATVVVRGAEAMGPRELLSLKLPDQPDDDLVVSEEPDGESTGDEGSTDPTDTTGTTGMTGTIGATESVDSKDATDKDGAGGKAARVAPSLDDLKPFERGPEITEIH